MITLQPAPPRRNLRISDLTDGNEARIFAALGIVWPPPSPGRTIKCPFPDHADKKPSWRWDVQKRLYACSCADPVNGRHGGDLADVIRRCSPDGLTDRSLGGIAKWLRELLARPIADEPVRRAAAGSQDAAKREQTARRAELAEQAANEARSYLERSKAARLDHPYIVAKGLGAIHGARQINDLLLIPVRNMAGEIRGVQRIWWNGGEQKFIKAFLAHSDPTGCFHGLGGGGQAAQIQFGSGWATSASAYEATLLPTVVCFSDSNITNVARAFRAKCPTAEFIMLADNDASGITACQEAAAAVGNARVVVAAGVGNKGDFNDIHVKHGLDEVARQILERH